MKFKVGDIVLVKGESNSYMGEIMDYDERFEDSCCINIDDVIYYLNEECLEVIKCNCDGLNKLVLIELNNLLTKS